MHLLGNEKQQCGHRRGAGGCPGHALPRLMPSLTAALIAFVVFSFARMPGSKPDSMFEFDFSTTDASGIHPGTARGRPAASWRMYRYREGGDAIVHAPERSILYRSVINTGIRVQRAESLEAALESDPRHVLVMQADRRNLNRLIQLREQLEDFQDRGGWVMLQGLAPENLELFNRLMDSDFIMRPFRVERVSVQTRNSPLAESLSEHNLTLQSRNWIRGTHPRMFWICHYTFSDVIDAPANIAPFTLPPNAPDDPFDYTPAYDDSDPYNFVNGMLNADYWRYIRQFTWHAPDRQPMDLTFRLRRPETIDRVSIWNNVNYSTIADIELIFDGDAGGALKATLPNAARRTDINLPQPTLVNETITIRLLSRRVRRRADLVGIDNVEFRRANPSPRVTALDSAGGLVIFERGDGGLMLNQLNLVEREPSNPANAAEKIRVLVILLQNMGLGVGQRPDLVL